jgi:hypothetical protein
VLDSSRIGDVESLPFAARVGVARWARREIGRHQIVTRRDEGADQIVADLATGAGDENLHAPRIMRSRTSDCRAQRLGDETSG